MTTTDMLPATLVSQAALPALVAAIFTLAGLVKGVVGLGLPTVSMALLALLMPPAQAAALLIVPSLVTNVWQIRPWATLGPLGRRLATMQLAVFGGTLVGAWLLGVPSGTWATVSLGVALVAYAVLGLSGYRLAVSASSEAWLSPLAGLVTGFVTAATGVFVIPAVPYLQAMGLQRDALIQAMGISFTVSTVALAMGLSLNGGFSGSDVSASALLLLPALLGMAAGQYLRERLSPALFRTCLMGSLALLGTHMIVQSWLAH